LASKLAECVEAYAELDEPQLQRLRELFKTEQYQEVGSLMSSLITTTYERGKSEGKAEGKAEGRAEGRAEERRETALLLLEAKFGSLAPAVRERVATLSPEQLRQLLLDLVKSQSLQELHLED
jgi:flagellar biosynthesis/type III secretory pathway protein FliH